MLHATWNIFILCHDFHIINLLHVCLSCGISVCMMQVIAVIIDKKLAFWKAYIFWVGFFCVWVGWFQRRSVGLGETQV